MLISEQTREEMNNILQALFEANAECDNLAYNLDYHYFGEISKIYHYSFAHAFPVLADQFSDEMIKLNARPIRKPLKGFEEEISDLKTIFEKNVQMMERLRHLIKEFINDADVRDDIEARIFAENFLEGSLLKYLKQAYEWRDAANKLTADDLNVHFDDYTNFIDFEDD